MKRTVVAGTICAVIVGMWGLGDLQQATAAPANNIVWTAHNTGISGSSVVGLAIDPTATSTLYALTTSGGVYKTTTAGASWAAANTGLPSTKAVHSSHINGNLLTMDPNDPDTLYANFNGRVYKTTDGASSWSLSSTGIPSCPGGYAITGIAVDPTDSTHLLAGHTVSNCTGGIYESNDSGASWTHVETTGPINNDAWPLAFDPTDPLKVYGAPIYLGFLYSRDGGSTWTQNRPDGTSDAGIMVAVHPDVPTRVFFGDATGLYVSEDSGLTWTSHSADVPGTVYDVAFATTDSNIGYAVGSQGVFATSDGGVTWAEVGNHGSLAPRTVKVDPTNASNVFIGSYGTGVYRSTNGGTTFTEVNTGIPVSLNVASTAIAPSATDTYYTSVSGVGFFRSDDRGYTWEQQSSAYTEVNRSNYILIHPSNEDTIYAGFGAIYKSTDGGATFTSINNPDGDQYFQAAAIDPSNPLHLIVVDNASYAMYRSTDGGDTWGTVASFAPGTYTMKVRFDPVDSNKVYAATYDHFWKSTDNGVTWSEVTSGLDASANQGQLDALAVDPSNPSTIYVGNRADKVVKSTDSGETWSNTTYNSPTATDTPNRIIVTSAGTVYVFSLYGWQRSTDGGTTWTELEEDNLDSSFYQFKFTANIDPQDETRFLAGDFYDGVHIFENAIPDFDTSSAAVDDVDGGEQLEGDEAEYTVTVENSGVAAANSVELTVVVPDGATYVVDSGTINGSVVENPLSGGTLTFVIGTLLAGESTDVVFELTVASSLSSFDATITSTEDVSGTDVALPAFLVTAPAVEEEEEENNSGGGGSSRSSVVADSEEADIVALQLKLIELLRILIALLRAQ